MEKTDIKSLYLNELTEAVARLNLPKYKAKQIFRWLHSKNVNSFEEMTDISNKDAALLSEHFYITSLNVSKRLVSKLDDTVKYLYMLSDGNCIESVRMHYKHGYSVCISTQVGCKMGCKFCASSIAGFVRNLTPSEMLEQVYHANRDCDGGVSNVVLMGIGEPLDNFDAVIRFLNLLSDPDGFQMSLRHLSLSTSGLADRIRDLAAHRYGLTLSVSLHAPNDRIRSASMPVNTRWNIDALLSACRDYTAQTGRRISFEYALIDGVNDADADARELARRLKGMLCHVNLIPMNPVAETGYRPVDRKKAAHFMQILNDCGINTTIRRTLGADISAACGQLRREQSFKQGE